MSLFYLSISIGYSQTALLKFDIMPIYGHHVTLQCGSVVKPLVCDPRESRLENHRNIMSLA